MLSEREMIGGVLDQFIEVGVKVTPDTYEPIITVSATMTFKQYDDIMTHARIEFVNTIRSKVKEALDARLLNKREDDCETNLRDR